MDATETVYTNERNKYQALKDAVLAETSEPSKELLYALEKVDYKINKYQKLLDAIAASKVVDVVAEANKAEMATQVDAYATLTDEQRSILKDLYSPVLLK